VLQDGSATGIRSVSGRNLVWQNNIVLHRANPLFAGGGTPLFDFRSASNCQAVGNALFTINGGTVGAGLCNLLVGSPPPAENRFLLR
jgi:hypothetical protein